MFLNPQIYQLYVLAALLLYWSIPRRMPKARGGVLLGFSLLAIFIASPESFFTGLLLTAVTWSAVFILTRRTGAHSPYLPGAFIGLLILITAAGQFYFEHHAIALIGLSFMLLKAIGLILDVNRGDAGKPGLIEIATLHFFFPIFSAGPIESVKSFSLEAFQARFDWQLAMSGIGRILVGFFKLSFLSATILNTYILSHFEGIYQNADTITPLLAAAFILLHFLNVYINFSGYTDVAIGTGRLFSLKIMENFDRPYLATNIQEFWQRWHLSLGRFVNQYMIFPLARLARGSVFLALFFAFTIIGFWHHLSLPYAVWGLMHGAALAIHYFLSTRLRHKPWYASLKTQWLYRNLARLLTLFYVSYVSAFANSGGITESLALTKALLGL